MASADASPARRAAQLAAEARREDHLRVLAVAAAVVRTERQRRDDEAAEVEERAKREAERKVKEAASAQLADAAVIPIRAEVKDSPTPSATAEDTAARTAEDVRAILELRPKTSRPQQQQQKKRSTSGGGYGGGDGFSNPTSASATPASGHRSPRTGTPPAKVFASSGSAHLHLYEPALNNKSRSASPSASSSAYVFNYAATGSSRHPSPAADAAPALSAPSPPHHATAFFGTTEEREAYIKRVTADTLAAIAAATAASAAAKTSQEKEEKAREEADRLRRAERRLQKEKEEEENAITASSANGFASSTLLQSHSQSFAASHLSHNLKGSVFLSCASGSLSAAGSPSHQLGHSSTTSFGAIAAGTNGGGVGGRDKPQATTMTADIVKTVHNPLSTMDTTAVYTYAPSTPARSGGEAKEKAGESSSAPAFTAGSPDIVSKALQSLTATLTDSAVKAQRRRSEAEAAKDDEKHTIATATAARPATLFPPTASAFYEEGGVKSTAQEKDPSPPKTPTVFTSSVLPTLAPTNNRMPSLPPQHHDGDDYAYGSTARGVSVASNTTTASAASASAILTATEAAMARRRERERERAAAAAAAAGGMRRGGSVYAYGGGGGAIADDASPAPRPVVSSLDVYRREMEYLMTMAGDTAATAATEEEEGAKAPRDVVYRYEAPPPPPPPLSSSFIQTHLETREAANPQAIAAPNPQKQVILRSSAGSGTSPRSPSAAAIAGVMAGIAVPAATATSATSQSASSSASLVDGRIAGGYASTSTNVIAAAVGIPMAAKTTTSASAVTSSSSVPKSVYASGYEGGAGSSAATAERGAPIAPRSRLPPPAPTPSPPSSSCSELEADDPLRPRRQYFAATVEHSSVATSAYSAVRFASSSLPADAEAGAGGGLPPVPPRRRAPPPPPTFD